MRYTLRVSLMLEEEGKDITIGAVLAHRRLGHTVTIFDDEGKEMLLLETSPPPGQDKVYTLMREEDMTPPPEPKQSKKKGRTKR